MATLDTRSGREIYSHPPCKPENVELLPYRDNAPVASTSLPSVGATTVISDRIHAPDYAIQFSKASENLRISRFGPPTVFSRLKCHIRRSASFFFSFSFLGSLLVAALTKDLLTVIGSWIVRRPLAGRRVFLKEEQERAKYRTRRDKVMVLDIGYYASLVGLEVQRVDVIAEDRFVLDLFRIIDPTDTEAKRRSRYPVLLIHGLLQSAGAFCVNEEDSLAFFLCKSGYDVWLGNNRCGFKYKHLDFHYNDPRMWEWDVRDMGTKDLPAFVDHILHVTGHEKLGLVCHSQGTAQTFLALSTRYRPELGLKISAFCALAPAVYAGPLVDRPFFKFMRYLHPRLYRLLFGIHAFIPTMITLKRLLPAPMLQVCSYAMFHFMFNWTDLRWDKFLEGRMFQFSPVYISAESMRWWLGRDGFATRRCIFEDNSHADPWFDERCPPMALWIAENDSLVDGVQLLERLENSEPHVAVVSKVVLHGYEHLDVLWALDAVDLVGQGVKQVLWETAWRRAEFTCPAGCEER
ncbi:Alpha/Beta hydrolase protein [Limtongia smithiae]|uniref:Alpha/Beta hydrolase protein n=1 Tax=Limtongia smithiae TaxID=1125753 RepID=UPI0034CFC2B3